MNMPLSPQRLRILRAIKALNGKPFHAYYIMQQTRLPGGTVRPYLKELVKSGHATAAMEERSPEEDAGPQAAPLRKLYTLTKTGEALIQSIE
jgi:DNA-binding PadR family transcriptional regulator